MVITRAIEAAKNGYEVYREGNNTFTVFLSTDGRLLREKGDTVERFVPNVVEMFAKDWEIRAQGAPIHQESMHNILNLMNKQFVAAL